MYAGFYYITFKARYFEPILYFLYMILNFRKKFNEMYFMNQKLFTLAWNWKLIYHFSVLFIE